MVLHATLGVMAFNFDHINGNLWNRVGSTTFSNSETFLNMNGVRALILPDLVQEAKLHFGCELNSFPMEAELNTDQIYWEKRYVFYDVRKSKKF